MSKFSLISVTSIVSKSVYTEHDIILFQWLEAEQPRGTDECDEETQ